MRTVTSKDGTTIAYDQSGEGPALIIVNGASATRGEGASLADLLAPGITVIAYDRRGRGDSSDTAPYAVAREVEDIAALLDAAGGSGYVMGHSSGAVLALEAARQLPGKISKLVMYEPPFIIDDSRPPAPADYEAHLEGLIAAGRRGDAMDYFMRYVGTPEEMIAGMRQSPYWPAMERHAVRQPGEPEQVCRRHHAGAGGGWLGADGQRGGARLSAPCGGRHRQRPAQRPAPHAGGPGPRRRSRRARARGEGVPGRLSATRQPRW
jgi:pimeloyl-ACP methyl ester carboxylesterase